MDELLRTIDRVRSELETYREHRLNERRTRTIIIDPILGSLGWSVRDLKQVDEEYPTVDGKSVDYALLVNGAVALLVEAKPLADPLADVKAITQVVGYATNDGVAYCILTNGIKWQVYCSMEQCPAPDKLMFEVSLDPSATTDSALPQLAERMWSFSREGVLKRALDGIRERTFVDGRVRTALDALMRSAPRAFLNLVTKQMDDPSLSDQRVKDAIARVWARGPGEAPPTPRIAPPPPLVAATPRPGPQPPPSTDAAATSNATLETWIMDALRALGGAGELSALLRRIAATHGSVMTPADEAVRGGRGQSPTEKVWEYRARWMITNLRRAGLVKPVTRRGYVELVAGADADDLKGRYRAKRAEAATKAWQGMRLRAFDESHHTQGKPDSVLALYRRLDEACHAFRPGEVEKQYLKQVISYRVGKQVFCQVHLLKSGLKVWLKLRYADLQTPPPFARDVSTVGHWGSGDLELAVATPGELEAATPLIRLSLGP